MKTVVAFAKQALKTMSVCEAIRATTVQFVDLPRSELRAALINGCKLNPATVHTQIQRGRMQANA